MDNVAMIPYYAHEGIVTRLERCNRRLLGALAVAVTVIVIESIMLAQDEEEPDD